MGARRINFRGTALFRSKAYLTVRVTVPELVAW